MHTYLNVILFYLVHLTALFKLNILTYKSNEISCIFAAYEIAFDEHYKIGLISKS